MTNAPLKPVEGEIILSAFLRQSSALHTPTVTCFIAEPPQPRYSVSKQSPRRLPTRSSAEEKGQEHVTAEYPTNEPLWTASREEPVPAAATTERKERLPRLPALAGAAHSAARPALWRNLAPGPVSPK